MQLHYQLKMKNLLWVIINTPQVLFFSSSIAWYWNIITNHGIMLDLFQMTHASVLALCRSIKLQCELYPSRNVVLCLDPYSGLAAVLWTLVGQVLLYNIHTIILAMSLLVDCVPFFSNIGKEMTQLHIFFTFAQLCLCSSILPILIKVPNMCLGLMHAPCLQHIMGSESTGSSEYQFFLLPKHFTGNQQRP